MFEFLKTLPGFELGCLDQVIVMHEPDVIIFRSGWWLRINVCNVRIGLGGCGLGLLGGQLLQYRRQFEKDIILGDVEVKLKVEWF